MSTASIAGIRIRPVAVTREAPLLYRLDTSVTNAVCYLPARNVREQEEYLRDSTVFVAYDADTPAGFVAYSKDGDGYEIRALVVSPAYQHKGVGQRLMGTVLERTAGTPIHLVTHPGNTRAVIFYLRNGFSITGWGDNYYGDGQPRLKLLRGA